MSSDKSLPAQPTLGRNLSPLSEAVGGGLRGDRWGVFCNVQERSGVGQKAGPAVVPRGSFVEGFQGGVVIRYPPSV